MDRHRVGDVVRARRDALGLTVRAVEVASDGAVKFSTLNQIENGDLNTTIDMLAEVAKVLRARWEIQLVPEGSRRADPAVREILDRLTAILDQLDERDMRHLRGQVAELEREIQARTSR